MIIARTPYRVSLFGGGTDYPRWYREHGGAVLGFALEKYCYIAVRTLPPFFEHKHRIVYSQIETVGSIDEIQHPAVRAVMRETGVTHGLEIHHVGDLPAYSGLGSSSAFTVGLLHAIHVNYGISVTKSFLAREAIRIEQEVIAENVGSQDQIWAAYGGFNRINFFRDGAFQVTPLDISRERETELLSHLLLFFTGVVRHASTIAQYKIANLHCKSDNLHRLDALVAEAEAVLTSPAADIGEIGLILQEGWRLKRDLASAVSSPVIDDIYAEGLRAGARGGKLLGAGGGGFLLFFVDPERQPALRHRLSKLVEVPCAIDRSGSQIINR